MNIALAISATGILLAILIALIRAYRGPTLFDRVLAINAIGTMITLLIALTGRLVDTYDFTDIAMLYALMNFVGTVAALKFFRYRGLSDSARRLARPPDARKIFYEIAIADPEAAEEQK